MGGLLRILLIAAAGVFTARRLRRSKETASVEEHSDQPTLKRRGKRLATYFALFIAVLGIGGFLVAAAGIIPIKASSGHWGITRWFLSFSMSRSVAFHSMGIEAPPADSLDSPLLVLKGAGHYETGCRPCHGSPDLHYPTVAEQMTPHPPYLPEEIPKWDPEELFYIVKHGVKFTGMPAWPARHRDDEVWAMVAFLRALPNLDAAAYGRLTHGDAAPVRTEAPIHDLLEPDRVPPAIAESCSRCHGADGLGRGTGAFPKLAGQRPAYLVATLQAYARGDRHSGIMEPIAAGLSDDDIRELARYYENLGYENLVDAARPAPPATDSHTVASMERGEEIAHRGIPRDGIPSCADCHGPSDMPRNPHYPLLAGQYAEYLVLQLDLFNKDQRGGSPYARLMHPTAHRLTPEQMRDVAAYYASLPAGFEQPAP